MSHPYQGDIFLKLQLEEDIALSERVRKGVKYSLPQKPLAEILEYENLRDQALVARIRRATNRKKRPA